tara:strand:- start:6490 stop:7197 length:708 start_codon:yes stop_codon:yes gene_type:complete
MKVLILGSKGMLGHMVHKYLKSLDVKVETYEGRWPEDKSQILEFNGDYIINCIGAIPQRRNVFNINYELPIWLDSNTSCKIIHPGTDCDDDDDYGNSKKKATNFILTQGKNTKIIKTSILGPELQGGASLLEWFLSQKEEINGYTRAIWNGNTTLEWAKHCYEIILEWGKFETETVLQGETISKYDLLKTISEVYNKQIKINPIEKGVDRRLLGDIKTPNIKTQLIELKQFGNSK